MGGGQDKGQIAVGADLQSKAKIIKDHIESDTPALTICGGYQLFGKYFLPLSNQQIEGIGIFDVVTKATQLRMIGNVVCVNDEFGVITGFENHSGQTFLGENSQPLAKVTKGYGNTGKSGYEGVMYRQAIGTYLHGPLLPKNPALADFLLTQAIVKIEPNYQLKTLDDSLANRANTIAQNFRQ
jgi:CobQ-like glutamine amidotransferase family enzyme